MFKPQKAVPDDHTAAEQNQADCHQHSPCQANTDPVICTAQQIYPQNKNTAVSEMEAVLKKAEYCRDDQKQCPPAREKDGEIPPVHGASQISDSNCQKQQSDNS